MRIAVLMTCHNRKDETMSCLLALYNCILPDTYSLSVYLVDDASTDGTSEYIRNKYPNIIIIEGNGNLFWNRGMHLAWQTASKNDYDFYLWLNDDTILVNNAIQGLISNYTSLKNDSILVGTTISKKNGKITYGGRYKNDDLLMPNGEVQRCTLFNGNCILISKKTFYAVGNLDPYYHHSLGDFDYSKRAINHNISIYLGSNIVGFCEEHESIPAMRNSKVSLSKRIMALYNPLGYNPIEYFHYDHKNENLSIAILHFITIHFKTIFPKLWKK